MAVETQRVRRTNRDPIDAPDQQLGVLTHSSCVSVCVHSCVCVCVCERERNDLLNYSRGSFHEEQTIV